MKDLDKINFLLNLLSKSTFTIEGAPEAFSFAQSYSWLSNLKKKIEENEEGDK